MVVSSSEKHCTDSKQGSVLDSLHYIVVLSFLNYQDEIKQDEDLTKAYENLLENLIDLNSERAAVLLDELRLH